MKQKLITAVIGYCKEKGCEKPSPDPLFPKPAVTTL